MAELRRYGWAVALLLGGFVSAAPAQEAFKIDPVHSSVVFRAKHLKISYFYGRFNEFSGSFSIDKDNPAKCSIQVELNTNSIDTGNTKRDQHLRGPDFFNVKQFPTATFKSSSARAVAPGKLAVTGELTLHGTTKPVTVAVEVVGEGPSPFKDQRMGIDATFTIKRSEFGISYSPDGLGEEVVIMVGLEGFRK